MRYNDVCILIVGEILFRQLIEPFGYLVNTRFSDFKFVLLDYFANLHLYLLRIDAAQTFNEVVAALLKYGNQILSNA